jgi:hypothetical protein
MDRHRRSQTTREIGSPKNSFAKVKKKRQPPKRLESVKTSTLVNTTTPVTPVFDEGKHIVLSSIDSMENVKSSKGLLTNVESKGILPGEISQTNLNKSFNFSSK